MHSNSPTILLVMDDPTLGAVTAFRLELMGYRVETVSSAEAAFDVLERETPGLILVDLMLDDSKGFHIAERLSNDERSAPIPLMGLSSNSDLHYVQRAFLAGAEDYLAIPYDPAVLEDKLQRWLPLSE